MSNERGVMPHDIAVVIPAFNEQDAIARVISDIPANLVTEVVVVDNNSTDATAACARDAGATVLHESQPGYGHACQKGIDYLGSGHRRPDVVVFLDGDYSDFPEELPDIVRPIVEQSYDFVIGSRLLGTRHKGSMPVHQVIGNRLLALLIRSLYGTRFTDMGPFRAIAYDKLVGLDMRDRTYGWTAEMQVKAAKRGLRMTEVPVSYRKRIGRSKITGTVRGTILATYRILVTIIGNL
jgi:glycosyltransferase involved in cell wall biosynthesis